LFLVFAVGQKARAQDANIHGSRTTRVVRTIDMRTKEEDEVHRLANASRDTSLFEMIVDAIRLQKLTAYDTSGSDFQTTLSREALTKAMTVEMDVDPVIDPLSGKVDERVVAPDFNYSSIHKYGILEEWVFNPHTGKTDIQILGLAPLRETYNENGGLRDVKAMFWVKYNDVRAIIAKYEQYHPDNTIALHIWNDYFLNDIRPELVK